MKPKHKIIIVVEGGVIQFVDNIPPNTIIEVRDYDCDGWDDNRLKKDELGDLYYSAQYENVS